MAWSTGQPQEALANAVPYLQAFGHLVLAWIWLDVSASCRGEANPKQTGRQAAAQYFYRYELPKIDAWLNVVGNRDMTCANLSEEAF
jgi:butyryl-CoA dehydrogenase